MLDCVVVGAGPAGLACTKELVENGITDVVCVEKGPELGGVFVDTYDNLILTSSMYYSMFSDFWIGDDRDPEKHFWTKTEVVDYWTRYAKHFDIFDRIRFNSGVSKVTETDDGWTVELESGEVLETKRIAVASGTNRAPRYPEWVDQLSDISHSHVKTYRNAEPYKGKNVLMVGGGESGSDIAYEVSQQAKNSWVSLRSAAGWIVPRARRGIAADIATHRGVWGLPRKYGAALSSRLRSAERQTEDPVNIEAAKLNEKIGAANGIWGTYGTKTFAMPTAIVKHGCKVVSEITEVRDGGRCLVSSDGDVLENVDHVVFSTGYTSADTFLPDEYATLDPRSLYKHSFHPEKGDKIAWIGRARPNFGSQFPIMEMQARIFAQVVSKKMVLADQKKMNKTIAKDHAKDMEQFESNAENIRVLVDYYHYMDGIAEILGCKPPLAKYFLTKPKLWMHLVYGPTQASQYRLVGRDAKPELAEGIIRRLPISSWKHAMVKGGLRGRVKQFFSSPKAVLTKAS